ncbi:MAG: glycoside hydrolase family 3 C-terminal domain-containing protein [Chloroflexi bacterium]|nr:glycoside hydrolase family 3 C-terminal domain-containing protein [Chloroflexota bacterium]MBL7061996.1 glycoside hydrolase family 3 C-terminal domain-containing protein [Dehalococcoidia bacterium]
MEIYRDASQSIDARAKGLISKMTLDEKMAQLGGIWSYEVLEAGRFSPKKAESLLKNGIGQICRPGVSTGFPPKDMAELINGIQKFLAENTRLGIPALVHEECLNGFMAKNATIFPQIIGMASTWEPELVDKMTRVIRAQMMAVGVRQGLSPVLDVVRDPRWGRVEENYGEDPYLVATMGMTYVKGLQSEDIKHGVVATLKHFVGYGKPEGGLNWAPADIPPRMLREVYLYPFEKAIKEGGALSVMNAYHEIDGIPCGASTELLTDILRNEWGFEGVVISDYYAVDNLQSYHRVAPDKANAARLALTAGIDSELPSHDCYAQPLKEQIEKGLVSKKLIDRAVFRILRLKFMVGLFENPYVKAEDAAKVFDLPEHRKLALETARKSIVLLKNEDNILPLSKNIKTIAIIGPNADVQRNLLGDYTYPAHIEITIMAAEAIGAQSPAPDERADHVTVPVVTILEGIKVKLGKDTRILYAAGCEYNSASKDGFPEAVKAARAADVAIVAVGGKSGLTPDCTCGEMRDSAELRLPGVQDDLVRAIYETGTPVVFILVDGRPLALGWVIEKIPAIIEAWLPGEEGGNAVADVIFGDYNPGGKLPISFPAKVGQIPVYYGHKPSGSRSQFWGDYVDASTSPAFEFGYGLSYTTFNFSNLQVEPKQVPLNGKTSIKVDIENTGNRAGEEVAQLYIKDVIASITRPVKELKGFKRVALEPGETRTVEFELPAEALGFYGKDMEFAVEPGVFKVMVGRSSKDILLEDEFEVVA